jgi:hypothetical protein
VLVLESTGAVAHGAKPTKRTATAVVLEEPRGDRLELATRTDRERELVARSAEAVGDRERQAREPLALRALEREQVGENVPRVERGVACHEVDRALRRECLDELRRGGVEDGGEALERTTDKVRREERATPSVFRAVELRERVADHASEPLRVQARRIRRVVARHGDHVVVARQQPDAVGRVIKERLLLLQPHPDEVRVRGERLVMELFRRDGGHVDGNTKWSATSAVTEPPSRAATPPPARGRS